MRIFALALILTLFFPAGRTCEWRLYTEKTAILRLAPFLFKPSAHACMALGLNKKTGFQPAFFCVAGRGLEPLAFGL